MALKIALLGNPNSGKTTMFNDLTGSAQYVGNWPGVTVEKKEGALKGHPDVIITDLPGIYSLSPYTPEEVVSRNYLLDEKPDMIINIVDGANIERNLYLTTQLTELGIPVMIVMNMMDIVRRHGDRIDLASLGRDLGCEIAETAAVRGEGTHEAIEKAIRLLAEKKQTAVRGRFSAPVERALLSIEKILLSQHLTEKPQSRWFAIKLFERDAKIAEKLAISTETAAQFEAITAACEKELEDDCESIITNERYAYITEIVKRDVDKHNKTKTTVSDRIDAIITNRFLALPIFAVVMFLVYYLSITGIGGVATDWVNGVLFGDIIPSAVSSFLSSVGSPAWFSSLMLDGIIGGV
ncbi:MAG: ferrous iron transporter B, partial [Clostridiales bacterium]|nr:ferrous iron transporter B [Clostridiales bacterium]